METAHTEIPAAMIAAVFQFTNALHSTDVLFLAALFMKEILGGCLANLIDVVSISI